MIVGAHSILYSKDADRDRAFLRDVLGFPSVDVGGGWLIFGLPPAEVAVHPGEENDVHEFYLMTDDLKALLADLKRRRVACTPPQDRGWGVLSQITLPGGGTLGVYEPRHARPKPMRPKPMRPRAKASPRQDRGRATRPPSSRARARAASTGREKK